MKKKLLLISLSIIIFLIVFCAFFCRKAYNNMQLKHDFYKGYYNGYDHYIDRNYSDALNEFEKIKYNYENAFREDEILPLCYYYYYARCLFEDNQYEKALVFIDEQIKIFDENHMTDITYYYELYKYKAISFYKLGKYKEAEEILFIIIEKEDEIMLINPDIILVSKFVLAYTEFYLSNYEKSIMVCNSIADINIDDSELYNEILVYIEELRINIGIATDEEYISDKEDAHY